MNDGQASFLEVRLALFQLLQVAYAAPTTPDLADALADVALAYGELVGGELPPLAPLRPERDAPEFSRLFVGPGVLVAPPYESVYRSPEHALMQDETLGVRAWYRQYGLALPPERREPDDHIALEFEFYAHLQQQAMIRLDADSSLHQADRSERAAFMEAQRRFFAEHLATWVPTFCSRILDGTRSPFYSSLAAITRAVIHLEKGLLSALTATPASDAKEESHA